MNFETLMLHWKSEVSNKKKTGSRIGLISNIIRRAMKHNNLRYLLMFRLAQYLNSGNAFSRYYARRLVKKLNLKYGVDISIEAKIGFGFRIVHLTGVVITGYVRAGHNLHIHQNTTIGIKTLGLQEYQINIGDNVTIGANCCIIGDTLNIEDNVTIGAMTFVNKNLSEGVTFINAR